MLIRLLAVFAAIALGHVAIGMDADQAGAQRGGDAAIVDSQTFLEAQTRAAPRPSPDAIRHAADLVRRMTLKEKVGQMTQLEIGMVTDGKDADLQINPAKLRKAVVEYGVGSVLNVKDLA